MAAYRIHTYIHNLNLSKPNISMHNNYEVTVDLGYNFSTGSDRYKQVIGLMKECMGRLIYR